MKITFCNPDLLTLRAIQEKIGESLPMEIPSEHRSINAEIIEVNFGKASYTIEVGDDKLFLGLRQPVIISGKIK